MDDGSPIRLKVTIDENEVIGRALIPLRFFLSSEWAFIYFWYGSNKHCSRNRKICLGSDKFVRVIDFVVPNFAYPPPPPVMISAPALWDRETSGTQGTFHPRQAKISPVLGPTNKVVRAKVRKLVRVPVSSEPCLVALNQNGSNWYYQYDSLPDCGLFPTDWRIQAFCRLPAAWSWSLYDLIDRIGAAFTTRPFPWQVSSVHFQGSAKFDFTGTGPEMYGNRNAPRAIAFSAIIYCLRCMVAHDIPLNQVNWAERSERVFLASAVPFAKRKSLSCTQRYHRN